MRSLHAIRRRYTVCVPVDRHCDDPVGESERCIRRLPSPIRQQEDGIAQRQVCLSRERKCGCRFDFVVARGIPAGPRVFLTFQDTNVLPLSRHAHQQIRIFELSGCLIAFHHDVSRTELEAALDRVSAFSCYRVEQNPELAVDKDDFPVVDHVDRVLGPVAEIVLG